MVVLSTAPALTSAAISAARGRQPSRNRAHGEDGSPLGSAAGALGSVAVVSALGLPGLSAAFGGGMAAGTVAVVAAAAVAAAVVGYGGAVRGESGGDRGRHSRTGSLSDASVWHTSCQRDLS
jgi:hypothetical protein